MLICLIKLWQPKNCPHIAIHLVSLNVLLRDPSIDSISYRSTINILEGRISRIDFQLQNFEGC